MFPLNQTWTAEPQVMVNFKSSDTRQAAVPKLFPDGVPQATSAIISQVERYFDLGAGALNGYKVTVETNGNVLIRPEAVFGH